MGKAARKGKKSKTTPHFIDRKTRHEKIHCCTQDHTGNLGQSSQLQMASPEPVLGYLSMALNPQGAK